MFILLIVAVFGNLTQLQLKYDHCKLEEFKGEYCSIQKQLNELK
jgi:hypothetical protein